MVRDGRFDVVIAAGPRILHWPSAGVRGLSALCAEMGLSVGLFGGEVLRVRGVIPLPSTGGILLVEDIQGRIHRIRARAIVRVSAESLFPDPFPGWRSQGLVPLSTAQRLRAEASISWAPLTVVLGTGNKALRFGSSLLERGLSPVICVESYAQWGAKRLAGWEVERRRFEMGGGRVIEAAPVSLLSKSALLWELKLRDSYGVRVLEVGRVVSAGPFEESAGIREYPPGSLLFELEQTAENLRSEDVEGWVLEEERGRLLAAKIVRALGNDLGPKREELDRVFRRARSRLKRYSKHRQEPFTPAYQGKWVSSSDARQMRAFSGVPAVEHFQRPIASVECFEEIPCNVCAVACPENAISIGRVPRKEKVLDEGRCTSCGICISACPSQAISLVKESEAASFSQLVLSWRGLKRWKPGEFGTLLNRRGETLASARVVKVTEPVEPGISEVAAGGLFQELEVEVPTHLLWEARGIRPVRPPETEDSRYFKALERSAQAEHKVEIALNGDKRLARNGVSVSMALFEMGQSRPEDTLFCPDGSCGLCQVQVDGVKKLACQAEVHRGMAIRWENSPQGESDPLCPCLGITPEQVLERVVQGKLNSPEAVLSALHVGEGKCHGQFCMGAFKRLMKEQGLEVSQWIDWRFPWTEWVLKHN